MDMNCAGVGDAKRYVAKSLGNVGKFLNADFQEGCGMKILTQGFYRSICDGGSLPILYSEILRTARIMDETFSQLRSRQIAL